MKFVCVGHATYDTTLPLPNFPIENKKTRIEIWEAIDNERLHKKKFESPEDMHLYLNQILMKVGKCISVN